MRSPWEASADDRARVKELRTLVRKAKRGRVWKLSAEELRGLPDLYRFGSSLLAKIRTRGGEPELEALLPPLLIAAHGLLHVDQSRSDVSLIKRMSRYWLGQVPTVIREEWRLVALSAGLLYGMALVAYALVVQDLSMAYTLFYPSVVDNEVAQLRELQPGEAFRGNFNFGMEESAAAAGGIMSNNMRVTVTFFTTALLPPLYLRILIVNALMLGTYLGVASHWDQAWNIQTILWCHGVLELQAIVLAGTAGLILVRPVLFPGPYRRRIALAEGGRRSLAVLAATLPMLFAAGLIEGYVSPHAPLGVRLAVAIASGVLLVLWLGFGRVQRTE